MKQCTKCNKWKDENEFGKQSRHKDGLSYWCKDCKRGYERDLYRKAKGSVRKYYRFEKRHRLVDGVAEKQCSKCRKWKDENEFYAKSNSKDGLQHHCNKCKRGYERDLYRKAKGSVRKYYRFEKRHRLVDGVAEKQCSKCRKWKAESEFYKRSRHKDGLAVRCKECADKATNKCRERRLSAVRLGR